MRGTRESWGTVEAGGTTAVPNVRLDGDADAFGTPNGIPGYTPATNDRVRVLIVDGIRQRVTALKR